MHQDSPLLPIFAYCRVASTVICLPPKATFTPSIQPNLRLPRTRPPLTSAFNILLAIRYPSILSTCPNHLNTIQSALLANQLSIPALLRTSFLPLCICNTPTKLLTHFILITITFLLLALLIPHASVPYNAVGTINVNRQWRGRCKLNAKKTIAHDVTQHKTARKIYIEENQTHSPVYTTSPLNQRQVFNLQITAGLSQTCHHLH